MLQEYRLLGWEGEGHTLITVSLTFHIHDMESGSFLDPLLYICDISLVHVIRFFKNVRPQLHSIAVFEYL